jgi:hypothetical protein
MAALQGYFLRNKDDAQKAIDNVGQLPETIDKRNVNTKAPAAIKHSGPVKPRPVRPLTAEQVDKMYFNPQPGWDKDL